MMSKKFLGLKQYSICFIFAGCLALFSFQNCSAHFSSSSIVPEGTDGGLAQLKLNDKEMYESLVQSQDLVYWSSDGSERINLASFFGDSFSALAVVPQGTIGNLFEVQSGPNTESARLGLNDKAITAEHVSDASKKNVAYVAIPSSNKFFVVAAQFGVQAKQLRLIVNGMGKTVTTEATGIPIDFAYLEKKSVAMKSLPELMIFKRKLSSFELAALSRHTGRLRNFDFVGVDRSITVDSDSSFDSESEKFLAARAVLSSNSCFNCHSAWTSYGEFDFVKAQLVVSAQPAQSLLWTRLSGSPDAPPAGQAKSMPLYLPSLSAPNLQTLKSWIESIP